MSNHYGSRRGFNLRVRPLHLAHLTMLLNTHPPSHHLLACTLQTQTLDPSSGIRPLVEAVRKAPLVIHG